MIKWPNKGLPQPARKAGSPWLLTKWMNPAAVSHVLINMESRFTSLMELLCKGDKQSPNVTERRPICNCLRLPQHALWGQRQATVVIRKYESGVIHGSGMRVSTESVGKSQPDATLTPQTSMKLYLSKTKPFKHILKRNQKEEQIQFVYPSPKLIFSRAFVISA